MRRGFSYFRGRKGLRHNGCAKRLPEWRSLHYDIPILATRAATCRPSPSGQLRDCCDELSYDTAVRVNQVPVLITPARVNTLAQ